MALGREVSLGVGLACGALVWGIYNTALPTAAEARVTPPGDGHLAASERTATAISAAVVAGVSLIAKDPTVFVIGGSMIVALAWWHRHANHVNPETGKAVMPASRDLQSKVNATSAGYTPS